MIVGSHLRQYVHTNIEKTFPDCIKLPYYMCVLCSVYTYVHVCNKKNYMLEVAIKRLEQ